ncbi:signal peptidase complex subunit SPC2 [Diplogelasinospora grovesii]|uniref:Signal peptidase complex subunit 2 n=1 Tax=Diplogelasinospora grovesii TaxID=303347 RepID=A0AAN6N180_9PEZI|nr:signal peptidase complex subunit SPC2 [Diplogelasinospora grovesii]
MAVSQEKITLYNLADLKNTSDDAIPNYLNSLGFKQSHHLTDVRLGLGYTALALAGACFLWDYKLGFENTKYYTAAAVLLYSVLNGLLTVWIMFVEKGVIYTGTSKSGDTVKIATSTKKNVPQYNLTITTTSKSGKSETIAVSRPFTEWFDAAGHFVALPFQTMLATSIPAVGRLDPQRAQAGQDEKMAAYTPEMLAALVQENSSVARATAETSTTGADTGKKTKQRRKA